MGMKVMAEINTQVNLSLETMKQVAIDYICSTYGIKDTYFIQGGVVKETVDISTSHYNEEVLSVRPARGMDVVAVTLLQDILRK